MNTTLKKTLSFLLSVLMLFSCVSICVSAEGAVACCHDVKDPKTSLVYKETIAPTCAEGYDIFVCSVCSKEFHENVKEPVKAHTYEYSLTVNPSCVEGYDLYICTGCGKEEKKNVKAPTKEHVFIFKEKVEPTCTMKGYTVLMCNECHTTTFDESAFVPPIPHTFPRENIEYVQTALDDRSNPLYKQYSTCSACGNTFEDEYFYKVSLCKYIMKDGAEKAVAIENDVYAKKDGAILYDGEDPTLSITEYDNEEGDWSFIGWKIQGKEPLYENLEDIQVNEPMTVVAQFAPKAKFFTVTFFDINNKVYGGKSQIVGYKEAATIPNVTLLSYVDQHVLYTFEGWTYTDAQLGCVTEDMNVYPVYKGEAERVTVVFYSYDKKTPLKKVTCDWGTQISEIAPPASEMERENDQINVYEFQNEWLDAKGERQNIATDTAASLYPSYLSLPIKYTVVLSVLSEGVGSPKASYQIISSAGNLQAVGFTDGAGRAVLELPVGTYTVTGVAEDKLHAGDTTFTIEPGAGQVNVTVTLVENSEYYGEDAKKCPCICHSILGPIWIKILNLLYSVFSIRYVCCNDMFVTHGDKLKYT